MMTISAARNRPTQSRSSPGIFSGHYELPRKGSRLTVAASKPGAPLRAALRARLRRSLRRTVALFRLGLVLAFLQLFLLQQLLLFRVFLLQLLRLLLMLLLYLLFLSLIRLLLREFRVFLLLLLLDSLPFLFLLHAKLILLLLVLPVHLRVRGGLNNGPWRSGNLIRMDCRRLSRPIGLLWLRGVVRVYRMFRRVVSRTVGRLYSPVNGIRQRRRKLPILRLAWSVCLRRLGRDGLCRRRNFHGSFRERSSGLYLPHLSD